MDAEKLQRLVTTETPYANNISTQLSTTPGNYSNWL